MTRHPDRRPAADRRAALTLAATAPLVVAPGAQAAYDTRERSTSARWKEVALELTSTAENSTLNWRSAFGYIEDIHDGRGYTGGIVGFCSGTGDMLTLVRHYRAIAPGNLLAPYEPRLARIMQAPYGDRPALSHRLLGAAYVRDWKRAAGTSGFRRAQCDERDRVYWRPAAAQASRDRVGPLGQAILYDISVNHGPGSDWQSFGGIVRAATAQAPPPSAGGSEAAYLLALTRARDKVLKAWGDYQADGRSTAHRRLLADNPGLRLPIVWWMYGDRFAITRWPA